MYTAQPLSPEISRTKKKTFCGRNVKKIYDETMVE